MHRIDVEFCGDDELGYRRSRTRFTAGAGLALDAQYCLAHLPLVAPRHPRVIATRDGTSYAMGRHARTYSIVLPVPGAALRQSASCRKLESDIRASVLGPKIAWSLLPKREDRLHATICGSLAVDHPPVLDARTRKELAGVGSFQVEIRGLFSGDINVGRLYLRAYPERRGGVNTIRKIQRIFQRRETDLYLVGLFNVIDDLGAREAAALSELIERWWDRPLLRFDVRQLWLLEASDDLVLDSAVVESIDLV